VAVDFAENATHGYGIDRSFEAHDLPSSSPASGGNGLSAKFAGRAAQATNSDHRAKPVPLVEARLCFASFSVKPAFFSGSSCGS
jgi:hypothetical protein